MTEFIITTCVLHGEKVASDRESALRYRELVLDCIEGYQSHLHDGEGKGSAEARRDHEAEHLPGLSCWSCCDLMDTPRIPLEIGDTIKGTDMDGHLRVYTVIGFYADGTPRSHGFNAPHSDECSCYTSEDW